VPAPKARARARALSRLSAVTLCTEKTKREKERKDRVRQGVCAELKSRRTPPPSPPSLPPKFF